MLQVRYFYLVFHLEFILYPCNRTPIPILTIPNKGGLILFTPKELSMFKSSYFRVLRSLDNYIEIQSGNTKHCWIVQKLKSSPGTIILHHKHDIKNPYYHKHRRYRNCKSALLEIQSHDTYVLTHPQA